ncbi:MAG: hypothetical protein OXJ56_03250 [Rhodospirillaceae bacterium]|nr:hypothetical protein [Rhodospirillaceae bacterium]
MNWRDSGVAPAGTHHVRDSAGLCAGRGQRLLRALAELRLVAEVDGARLPVEV